MHVFRDSFRRSSFIFIAFISLLLAGCDDSSSGHFEGVFFELNPSLTEKVSQSFSQNVGIEVKYHSLRRSGTAFIVNTRDEKVIEMKFSNRIPGHAQVHIPILSEVPFQLKSGTLKNSSFGFHCYSSGPKDPYQINFCFGGDQFDLTVSDQQESLLLHLNAYRVARSPTHLSELPRAVNIHQIRQIASEMNFGSQIEYQNLIRAKSNAWTTYLNLMPHIGARTVFTLASAASVPAVNPILLVSTIGDLGPFLLPNRWLKAARDRQTKKAQEQAFKLMRLNVAFQAEGIAYSYISEKKSRQHIEDLMATARGLIEKVHLLEKRQLMRPGSEATLHTIIENLSYDRSRRIGAMSLLQTSLSSALGFLNPHGIEDVLLEGEELPIEEARPLIVNKVIAAASSRSVEVSYFNYLMKEAKYAKHFNYWAWMDPQGSPDLGLGLNMISQRKADQSNIRIVQLKQMQKRQEIMKTADNAANFYNFLISIHHRNVRFLAHQQARLDFITQEIRESDPLSDQQGKINTSMHDIQDVFQDYILAALRLEETHGNFRIMRAQIERLLLMSDYGKCLHDMSHFEVYHQPSEVHLEKPMMDFSALY